MSAFNDLEDAIVQILHPNHTAADLPPKPGEGAPVIIPETLMQARDTARALSMIASGWPELSRQGFEDYLTDAAGYLTELADAVEEWQTHVGAA